jgi:hypothetical protein
MEDDIDEAGYSCNSLSSFKAYLVQYNISTVYFEPFSDIDRHLSFYFNRTSGIYRIDIFIESYGLCQYRYEIN